MECRRDTTCVECRRAVARCGVPGLAEDFLLDDEVVAFSEALLVLVLVLVLVSVALLLPDPDVRRPLYKANARNRTGMDTRMRVNGEGRHGKRTGMCVSVGDRCEHAVPFQIRHTPRARVHTHTHTHAMCIPRVALRL